SLTFLFQSVCFFYIPLTRNWTNPDSLFVAWFQWVSFFSCPTNPTSGGSDDNGEVWNITNNGRSRANQCPTTDPKWGNTSRIGSNRSPRFNTNADCLPI